jgi:hypothetical protein
VNCVNAPPQLLRCDSTLNRSWVKIRLVGTKSNKTGIGARIKVTAPTGTGYAAGKTAPALVQIEEVRSCNGYYSASDLRIHFGLGEAKEDRHGRDSLAIRRRGHPQRSRCKPAPCDRRGRKDPEERGVCCGEKELSGLLRWFSV